MFCCNWTASTWKMLEIHAICVLMSQGSLPSLLWSINIHSQTNPVFKYNIWVSLKKTKKEHNISSIGKNDKYKILNQCDKGGEFDNHHFHNFASTTGLYIRFSCLHTFQQNGTEKRMIRRLKEIMLSLLAHASLPPSF